MTGARVEEAQGKSGDSDILNVDNLANSQALAEQNLMKDPAYAKKYGGASTLAAPTLEDFRSNAREHCRQLSNPGRKD